MKRSGIPLIGIVAGIFLFLGSCQSEDLGYFWREGSDPVIKNYNGNRAVLKLLASDTGSNSVTQEESTNGAKVAVAQWVKVVVGAKGARFWAITQDNQENVYAVGQLGPGGLDLGDGVSLNGAGALIVKYDSAGNVRWARSAEESQSGGSFTAVAVDKEGSVYAAGRVGPDFDFGNGVSDDGQGGPTALIKFDSDGTARWALSARGANLTSIVVGADGNIYLAGGCLSSFTGFQHEAPGFTQPAGATAPAEIAMLVKVDRSGNALWAKTAPGWDMGSVYNALTIDGAGNIYAAGQATGDVYVHLQAPGRGTTDFGNSVVVHDPGGTILVKYNSEGIAQWVQTVPDPSYILIEGMARDERGGIYIQCDVEHTGVVDFGNGVQVQTTSINANSILVKYNGDGQAQWARSPSNASGYGSVVVDASGLYIVAYLSKADGHEDEEFLVCYDFDGKLKDTKVLHGIKNGSTHAFDRDNRGATVLAGDAGESLDLGNGLVAATAYGDGFVAKYKE